MPTGSTAMLQSSSGQKKCKTTSVQYLYSQFYVVGVSYALVGMVDANRHLLRVGVGLLTASRGHSGCFGLTGAGDVAVSVHPTLGNGLMSLGCSSQRVWLVGGLILSVCNGPDPKGREFFLFIFNP